METLRVSSKNIYKTFKSSPFNPISALSQIINNSINRFKNNELLNENSIIVVYWNADENWIQIMDNTPGFENNDIEKLWWTYEDTPNELNWKTACFYLGNSVTIESKNEQRGFKTYLDLNNFNQNEVGIKFLKPEELIRSFKTGNRITIDNINKKLSNGDINNIYEKLSFNFKNVINKYKISIILAYIKDNTIYDLSNNNMVPVTNVASITKLQYRLPEYNSTKTINFKKSIEIEGKKIDFEVNAYRFLVSNKICGISYSIKDEIILGLDNLSKPYWFDETYKSVYIDVTLSGVFPNMYHTDIDWDNNIKEKIEEIIHHNIEPLRVVMPKNLTKPLINSDDQKYKTKSFDDYEINFDQTKALLTKAFNDTKSMGYVDDFEIIKNKLHFTYNADDGKKITMNLIKSKQKEMANEWLQLIPINQDSVEQIYEYDLKLNLNHPFFRDFMSDNEIAKKIEHFAICYAIAECITRLDGLPVTQLKYEINKLLRGSDD